MRWCQDIPPTLPLDEFIPEMRGVVMDNVKVFQTILRESFREDSSVPVAERIQEGISGLRQLNRARPDIEAYSRQWGESIHKMQERQSKMKISTATSSVDMTVFDERAWVQEQLDRISWLPKLEDCAPRSLDIDKATKFPLFPLRGTMFHQDTITPPEVQLWTLCHCFLPIPLPGLEVPLQIFEPRYRQL